MTRCDKLVDVGRRQFLRGSAIATAGAAAATVMPSEPAQALAGGAWPQVKDELLEHLARTSLASTKVDIYLHEGMVERAIEVIDQEQYAWYGTVEKVVDAAWQSHPDWVIRQCRAQAEPIMDQGKSRHYHHAVRWLGKARQAYLGAGQADAWRTYVQGLIDKHARKYSLRPQLEALRGK